MMIAGAATKARVSSRVLRNAGASQAPPSSAYGMDSSGSISSGLERLHLALVRLLWAVIRDGQFIGSMVLSHH